MNYKEEKAQSARNNLKKLLSTFPEYCKDYFQYCDGTLNRSALTMLGYAYNLNTFFQYLVNANPGISSIKSITFDILNNITPRDIQEYLFYLKGYQDACGKYVSNDASARSRQLSTLRSFYQYYYTFGGVNVNPAKLVETPRIHHKRKAKLDNDEVASLVEGTLTGEALDDKKKKYAEHTKYRDMAIVTLLLGTGIRVSELVGIDLEDIDWKNKGIKVIRKGGNEDVVYFGQSVEDAIRDYIQLERCSFDDEIRALFIGSRSSKERLSARSVERIVKKYAAGTVPSKKITPHSLRRTYGSFLYNETGDIYVTADALGHANIEVTAKYYSEISDSRKKEIKGISDKLL